MRSLLLAAAAVLVLFTGCAGATDSKPSIPVSLSGTGSYSAGQSVTLTANATYSGTGTLSYNFVLGGTPVNKGTSNKLTFTLPAATSGVAAGSASIAVSVTVTDGTLSGSASGTVTY